MEHFKGFPTKQELRELKRLEILRCASEMFGKSGYENVSLSAIASRLGVTKTALYHYVSGKSDLLMQCYQQGMDELLSAVTKHAKRREPAVERLYAALEAYVAILARSDMQYLWTYIRPRVADEIGRTVQDQRDELDGIIRSLIKQGIEDGSLRQDTDPKVASLVILGAVNWVGIWHREQGEWSPKEIARRIAGDVIRGYLVDRDQSLGEQ